MVESYTHVETCHRTRMRYKNSQAGMRKGRQKEMRHAGQKRAASQKRGAGRTRQKKRIKLEEILLSCKSTHSTCSNK
eukprot:scaffold156798_cov34-Prasinocladus_malaysianus.AAC.2